MRVARLGCEPANLQILSKPELGGIHYFALLHAHVMKRIGIGSESQELSIQ